MAVPQERWCVVTGGRGFAARHLVDMLIRYEIYSVRIADLGPDIKLETHEEKGNLGQALRLGRAQYVSMDLRDKSQVNKGNLLGIYFFLLEVDLLSGPVLVLFLLKMNSKLLQ